MSIVVEELDLDAEDASRRRARATQTSSLKPEDKGFGILLDDIKADVARRLRLADGQRGAYVSDVEQGSGAWEGFLRPNDVIVKVNFTPVANATEAQRELQKVPAGGTALVHVVKQDSTPSKGYREVFLMLTKE
jgi:S1-C subfamily serine protease